MTGHTAEILAFVAGVTAAGAGTHVALFGPRRAPIGTVRLSPRQWATVGAIGAGPVGTVTVLLSSAGVRGALVARFGSAAPGRVIACSFLMLVAVVYGMAPSLRDADAPAGGGVDTRVA